jgi:acetyl-CoA acetyltransferase
LKEVFIDGVGMISFGKYRDRSLVDLMAEAAVLALKDSSTDTVEAIFVGTQNPEEFTGDGNVATMLADRLNLSGIPAWKVETASSSGASVLEVAFMAIASGRFSRVLVVAGEKMTHLDTPKVTRILAEVIEPVERASGASMVALAAMVTQSYAHFCGLSLKRLERILCKVAMKNHYYGSLNPYAQFRNPISEEDYFSSRMISYPLRLYDCAPITDGACACVLTSYRTDIKISGVGHGTDTLAVRHRIFLHHFNAARIAAREAYKMANRSPEEIDFAELHDAFTCFEIIASEDLGFFEEGKGWKAVERNETTVEGKLPINVSGGLKARGHPVGASGLAQAVEIVWQMRGLVPPERRVKKNDIALLHSIGGLSNNNVIIIFEKTGTPMGRGFSFDREIVDASHHKRDPIRVSEIGTLDAYTVLEVPPEGFPRPLVLGLVSVPSGHRILARAAMNMIYKVGERVIVMKEEDTYYFMRPSKLEAILFTLSKIYRKLKIWLKRKLL